VPQPTSFLVGRWAKTAAAGVLLGAPLTEAQQVMALWTAITAGKFSIVANGFAAVEVDALDFSAEVNLNGVASQIDAGLTTAGVAATCVWDGSKFVFTSKTQGATSGIPLLVPIVNALPPPPTDPDDISVQLGCTATNLGALSVPGMDPESALDAVTLFDEDYGYQWYALVIPEASQADHEAIAPFIQGTVIKHFYGITTQDPGVLQPTQTDIAAVLSKMALTKTAVQYSSTSNFAVISALARIMTTDYTANSSVITLMYKQEPGVAAEFLNRTQMNMVMSKNCNVFVAYAGGALIIQPGTTTSTNQFIDTIMGVDNLAIDIQLAIFNLLYTTPTKIPQTDSGMNTIVNAAESVLLEYVNDGLLAPGTWTQAGFGGITQGEYLEKGYYIYCPPLAQQSSADRAARMAGPITIGVKLAGAVHTASALIFVNP
jgi:hypothetical protein